MLTARLPAAAKPQAFRGRPVFCWGEVSPHAACGGGVEILLPCYVHVLTYVLQFPALESFLGEVDEHLIPRRCLRALFPSREWPNRRQHEFAGHLTVRRFQIQRWWLFPIAIACRTPPPLRYTLYLVSSPQSYHV